MFICVKNAFECGDGMGSIRRNVEIAGFRICNEKNRKRRGFGEE